MGTKTQVQLAGGFSVLDPSRNMVSMRSHKAKCVLAYILYNCDRNIRRSEMVDLLWHDRFEAQGRASLRQAIYEIRTSIGAQPHIRFGRQTLHVDTAAFDFDLWFEPGKINIDCHGELLSGLDPASSVFDDWVETERRDLDRRRLNLAENLLADLAIGDPARAEAAERVLKFDPCNEAAAEIAMRAYAQNRAISNMVRVFSDIKSATEQLGFQLSNNLSATFTNLKTEASIQSEGNSKISARTANLPIVVVLPLEVQGLEGDGYLGMGLQDEIIGRLTLLPELRVLSSSEGIRIKEAEDPVVMARSFGATYLLSGTLFTETDLARVRLLMTEVYGGTQIWSDRRNIDRKELIYGIEALVDGIATTLVPAIERIETQRIEATALADYRSYDHYLKAKYIFFLANNPDYVTQAEFHLEKSVEIDPSFSPAYVHLIQSLNTGRIFTHPGAELETGRERALLLVDRLLKMDRRNANAHLALAWCLLWKRQFEAAERSLQEAMRLKPIEAHRLNSIGTALLYLGRKEDAEDYYNQTSQAMAHDLDYLRTDLGEYYYFRQDYERALTFLDFGENRLALRNQFWRALTLAQLGDLAEARMEIGRFLVSMEQAWVENVRFEPERAMRWILNILPLKLQIDMDNICAGLAKLGYNVNF